jgi:hypothetical protein
MNLKYFFCAFVFMLLVSCNDTPVEIEKAIKTNKHALRVSENDLDVRALRDIVSSDKFSKTSKVKNEFVSGFLKTDQSLKLNLSDDIDLVSIRVKDEQNPFNFVVLVGIIEGNNVLESFFLKFTPKNEILKSFGNYNYSELDILNNFEGSVSIFYNGDISNRKNGRTKDASLPDVTLSEIIIYGTPLYDSVNPFLYWTVGVGMNYYSQLFFIPGIEIDWTSGVGYIPLPADEDPIDITYFLTPVNQSQDVNNPTDGMKATDTHGVVYTFDSELGTWLLPEVAALLNNGYEVNFTIEPPSFNTTVLSTVWVVGLAEPTPVGEVVAAGTTIVVSVVYLYSVAAWYLDRINVEEQDWDTCLRLYDLCQSNNVSFCGDCLTICRNNQGEWPFWKCSF